MDFKKLIFTKFERNIAKKYAKSTRLDQTMSRMYSLSILGVALGVATIIIVMSLMNGFRMQLTNNLLGFDGHIHIYSHGDKSINNAEQIIADLTNNPQVSKVTPLIEKQILINNAVGAMVYGISQQDLKKRKYIFNQFWGDLGDWNNNSIIIGHKMAFKLKVGIGDKIKLISSEKIHTAFGSIPKTIDVTVVGLFNIGKSKDDTRVAFIPFALGKDFLNQNGINHIEIFLHNHDKVQDCYNSLSKQLNKDLQILNWKQINSGLFAAIKVERNVMFLILTLIVLTAILNIVSLLFLLVRNKSKDIAIMRSMGATNGTIIRIFLLIGWRVGTFGILIGLFFGTTIAYNLNYILTFIKNLLNYPGFSNEVSYLNQLSSQIDCFQMILVIIITWLIVLFASLFPAIKAIKLKPANIL